MVEWRDEVSYLGISVVENRADALSIVWDDDNSLLENFTLQFLKLAGHFYIFDELSRLR